MGTKQKKRGKVECFSQHRLDRSLLSQDSLLLETALPRAAPAPHIQSQPGHNRLFSLSSSLSGITDASRVLHVCLSTGLLASHQLPLHLVSGLTFLLKDPLWSLFSGWLLTDSVLKCHLNMCIKQHSTAEYQGIKTFNPEKSLLHKNIILNTVTGGRKGKKATMY